MVLTGNCTRRERCRIMNRTLANPSCRRCPRRWRQRSTNHELDLHHEGKHPSTRQPRLRRTYLANAPLQTRSAHCHPVSNVSGKAPRRSQRGQYARTTRGNHVSTRSPSAARRRCTVPRALRGVRCGFSGIVCAARGSPRVLPGLSRCAVFSLEAESQPEGSDRYPPRRTFNFTMRIKNRAGDSKESPARFRRSTAALVMRQSRPDFPVPRW